MTSVDANTDADVAQETRSLEELTKDEFNDVKDNISIQNSYYLDNIGRVHIRQTGEYITGLVIDDENEFHWKSAVMDTDLIIKVAIELIRYNRGQIIDFSDIPLMTKESDDVIEFLNELMNIPYGEVSSIKGLRKYKNILDDLEFDIIVPTHRVKNYKVSPEKEYYFNKLRKLENLNNIRHA